MASNTAYELTQVKKELARVQRLNQHLHNEAIKESAAHDEQQSELRETVRKLERRVRDTLQEGSQLKKKIKRIEQESEERRSQLDQAYTNNRLYAGHLPPGQQTITAKEYTKLVRLPSEPTPAVASQQLEDRQTKVIEVLQNRVQLGEVKMAEQVKEIHSLTEMLEKSVKKLSMLEPTISVPAEPTPSPTALQLLNVQVNDLHSELSHCKASLEEERQKKASLETAEAENSLKIDILRDTISQKNAMVASLTADIQHMRAAESPPSASAYTQTVEEHDPTTNNNNEESAPYQMAENAVLRRQIEILGKDLLSAREENSTQLEQMVLLQGKLNKVLRKAAHQSEEKVSKQIDAFTSTITTVTAVCEVQTDACHNCEEISQVAQTTEILELKEAVTAISNIRDALQLELDSKTIECRQLSEKTLANETEINTLTSRLTDLQQETSLQVVRVREQHAITNKEQDRCALLEVQLKELRQEKELLSREILQASEDFKQIIRENNYISQQLNEAVMQKDAAVSELDSALASIQEAEYTSKVKDEENHTLTSTYKQLCEEHEMLKRRLDNTEVAVHRAKNETMEQIRRTQEQHNAVEQVSAREQQTAIDLQNSNFEIDALNKRLLIMSSEKDAYQRDLDEAARRLNSQNSTITHLERKLLESERDHLLQIGELNHTKEQLQSCNSELLLTAKCLADQQRENEDMSQMMLELRKKEAKLFNGQEASRVDAIKWKETAVRSERTQRDAEHAEKEVQRKYTGLKEEFDSLTEKLAVSQSMTMKLESDLTQLKRDNDNLRRRYEAAEGVVRAQDEALIREESMHCSN